MPIIRSRPVEERGRKDARRHRDKQREVIKGKIRGIIADESIITRRKGKIVKVPIRSIVIPDFRPGKRKKEESQGGEAGGIGQGSGKPGDVIGKRPGKGNQPGEAGEEPGVDYIESEIDIEELIEMMLEDLGLPNLEKKEVAELEVSLGFRISGIRKSGPHALLSKKHTAQQGIGRFYAYLATLQQETGYDELKCCSALKDADGNLAGAIDILNDTNYKATALEVEPFLILHEDDLRYFNRQEKITHESNAAIIAMMDVSGSMTITKKYLARSMLFWLVEFLRKLYDNVDVRFIIHHTTAKLVEEHDFFHTGESGGTYCYTAYELARNVIETEYPTNLWNVYAFHFSDGDDFNIDRTIGEARKLIEETKINMFGYGEIRPQNETWWGGSHLAPAFKEKFPVEEKTVDGMKALIGKDGFPFLGVEITNKDHIWPALREFLKKDRWADG